MSKRQYGKADGENMNNQKFKHIIPLTERQFNQIVKKSKKSDKDSYLKIIENLKDC
jgi:hypothetical protein